MNLNLEQVEASFKELKDTLFNVIQERDTLKRERDEAIKARNHNRICVERLASELDQLRKVADELALGIQRNDLSPLKLYSQLHHVKQKETKCSQ